jgi:glycosyltransferase involved in cell wall biosynthesis
MTERTEPRVSVLMPVRNGMPWLPRALDSIFAQSFTDFELIVVDDGSTDGTSECLAGVDDTRLRVVRAEGVGIAHALNRGVAEARAALLARHDGDDESLPQRFGRQVEFLDAHPEVDVVATTAEYIDERGMRVESDWTRTVAAQQDVARTPHEIAELMPLTCCLTHGSVMARTAAVRKAGGYRAEMEPAEDYDLWLRMLPAHRFAKLDSPLYRYRLHGAQTPQGPVSRQSRMAVRAKLQYLRRQHRHLPARGRLALVGSGAGLDVYRRVAPEADFDVVAIDARWDVMAVTDLRRAVALGDRLVGHDGAIAHRVGNLFVRGTEVARAA